MCPPEVGVMADLQWLTAGSTEHCVVLNISWFRVNAIYSPSLLCTLRPQILCTPVTDCFVGIVAWCSPASIQLYFSEEKNYFHFTSHYMTFEMTRLFKEFHIGLELYIRTYGVKCFQTMLKILAKLEKQSFLEKDDNFRNANWS